MHGPPDEVVAGGVLPSDPAGNPQAGSGVPVLLRVAELAIRGHQGPPALADQPPAPAKSAVEPPAVAAAASIEAPAAPLPADAPHPAASNTDTGTNDCSLAEPPDGVVQLAAGLETSAEDAEDVEDVAATVARAVRPGRPKGQFSRKLVRQFGRQVREHGRMALFVGALLALAGLSEPLRLRIQGNWQSADGPAESSQALDDLARRRIEPASHGDTEPALPSDAPWAESSPGRQYAEVQRPSRDTVDHQETPRVASLPASPSYPVTSPETSRFEFPPGEFDDLEVFLNSQSDPSHAASSSASETR